MNRTTDAPLAPVHFLIIHLTSSVLFTVLAGRFRIAALACTGLAGGVSLGLILAVILHPTLLTRLIFIAILTPLSLVAVFLPVPRTQHSAVRAASSSTGAFGTVVSIALLAQIPSWANVWERLWMQISLTNEWGTSMERGLSAAACIILAGGIASDWALRRRFGENPDQKWDSYLAQYAANLPNANDRAGTFQPMVSLWQRLFHPSPSNPVIFPSDADLKSTRSSSIPNTFEHTKARSSATAKLPRKRSEVKFQPLGGYSDSDSDSEPEWSKKDPARAFSPPQKPWLQKQFVSSTTLSGATLYGSDDEGDREKEKSGGKRTKVASLENYSDSEGEDITTPHSTPLKRQKSRRDEPGWKPEFLARHPSESPTNASSVTAVSSGVRGAVPMTPSLIRAIDRIAVAQGEAYGHISPPPLPRAESEQKWRGFWDRVQEKAGSADQSR